MKAADLVVGAGGFGVVALDLCDSDARRRVADAAWVRLRHGARNQGTTVLVATSTRTLGTAAAAAIELGGGAPMFLTDGPPLFAGVKSRAARVRGGARDESAGRGSSHMRLACVYVPQLALQAALRRNPEARNKTAGLLEAEPWKGSAPSAMSSARRSRATLDAFETSPGKKPRITQLK